MLLNQLDSKKQFVILGVILALILGLYVQFRLIPAVDDINSLSKQLNTDQKLLKSPNVPDEPMQEVEDLEEDIDALALEIESLENEAATIEKKLPEINSQDVVLTISEAASQSKVRVVNNVPFAVAKRARTNTSGKSKKDKKLSEAERKKYEKALRKARKRARKLAKKNRSSTKQIGALTYEGELMDKLVNDFETSRPLHALKVEGTYNNIKLFIQSLQDLPWQITVVKIDYKLLGKEPPQGLPRPIVADMIIGM